MAAWVFFSFALVYYNPLTLLNYVLSKMKVYGQGRGEGGSYREELVEGRGRPELIASSSRAAINGHKYWRHLEF